MRAALAELGRSEAMPEEDSMCAYAEEGETSSDRISSRGLEILRILNDVFNGLPMETAVATNDRLSNRG
jgi:hypothetical protein